MKKRFRDLQYFSVARIGFRKTVPDYFSPVRGDPTIIIIITIRAVSPRRSPERKFSNDDESCSSALLRRPTQHVVGVCLIWCFSNYFRVSKNVFWKHGPTIKKRFRDLKCFSVAKIDFRKMVPPTTLVWSEGSNNNNNNYNGRLPGGPRKGNSAMTTKHARVHC